MKPIRVALSGSGFRLPAHLGALQAIVDAGYQVIELAGTSGGSIVAALYAAGVPLATLHDICMSLNWKPMMGFNVLTLATGGYLCSGDTLLQYLQKLTSGKTFSDLDIDLKVIASDLLTEKEFVFCKASAPTAQLALAARASASIPVVFKPVAFEDVLCVDGGCCDNVPASALTVDDVPRVGIYLESDDAPLKPGSYSLATLAPRMIDLLLASNESSHVALDTKNGAKIVRISTGFASSFDRNMATAVRQQLYTAGYDTTAAAIKAMALAA